MNLTPPAQQVAPVGRPWLDDTLRTEERVDLLLSAMTMAEKAGLFFHTSLSIGELDQPNPTFSSPAATDLVLERHMTHFNLLGTARTAREIAAWHNDLQRLAASTRLGIPVTLSTDPRHSFSDNPGTGAIAGPFSQWPEPLGLAALRDEDLVRRFGDIARQEYLAVGFRLALHPQVDLATEPRWSRQSATFGEDPDLTCRLGVAYVRGFQGDQFGSSSVSTMAKHFPGGGAQKDGEDPHFAYGREQVYPGGAFDLHLKPFEALLAAGTRQVMPYYGMPIGTNHEEVGFGFNKTIITGLLRDKYGFDGVVCTDWSLLTDSEVFGEAFPAHAWGLEHATPHERMIRALDAGVDQFGGEVCPDLLIDLVDTGLITESRVDVSARRILREKFQLGLFESALVDEDAADQIVGRADFRAAGDAAQRASITLIKNGSELGPTVLPLVTGQRIYVEGIDPLVARKYGRVVDDPADADIAILRLAAPFDTRPTVFENFFHAGSLDFPPPIVEHIQAVSAMVPTVVDVFADRPPILGPLIDSAAAVTLNWGANAEALLDVLTGAAAPAGRLPFDLPRSMAAVEDSRADLPFDTENPLYRFGHGLAYGEQKRSA